MFNEKLISLYDKKQLVSICLERNIDTFISGFILSMSENYILFLDLDIDGKKEAVMLIPREQILRYKYNGQYEKKMERLYNFQYTKENNVFQWNEKAIPDSFFSYIQKNNKYVGIYEEDNTTYGKILELTGEEILLQCYDLYGEMDGITVITINDVDVFEFNSKECCVLEILEKTK